MDAKPQRPRVLRVNDENMPMPLHSLPAGKTLHQRTKSTPALSALIQSGAVKAPAAAAASAALGPTKRVLGEVNANARVYHPAKDDSEVGKASPGKISLQDPVKNTITAPLARPATRPLASKPAGQTAVPKASITTTTSQSFVPTVEIPRKIAAKKSTKVLRDVDVNETALPNLPAPSLPQQPISQPTDKPLPSIDAVQRQEVRKTESVPLRDEAEPRQAPKPVHQPVSSQPAGYAPQEEYRAFLEYAQNGVVPPAPVADGPVLASAASQQYYDAEETQYEYDDGYTTGRSFGLAGEATATIVLPPMYTDKIKKELSEAKAYVEATRPAEDVEDEAWDTSMVAEYGDEIFEYMRHKESIMSPNPFYMEQQTEIQWSMRAVLIDWVVQVHQRFNLLPETLFLTVNYIDRFLSCKIVSLGKLQLVGATAIFIAAKYEEVQCPTISEIIYMVDGGYTAEELLKAERFMLSMLQFELGWPGPMSFLRRISKADDYDLETRTLAKYFLEVTIMDERFVGCPPSFLAAGAHCIARLMIYGHPWSQAHAFYSNYTFNQLKPLLKAMAEACESPREHHAAVYDKYTDKRYKRASTFVEGKIAEGFTLPFDTSALGMGVLAAAGPPRNYLR